MKTPKQEQFDEFLMDESDEFLLKMAEELKNELSEIKVSDDLIARTLGKISEQGKKAKDDVVKKDVAKNDVVKKDVTKEELNVAPIHSIKASFKHRRSYQWMKSLTVIAAACLVLLLGIQVAKNGLLIGNQKSTSESSANEWETVYPTQVLVVEENEMSKSAEPKLGSVEESVGLDDIEESATSEKAQYEVGLVDPQVTENEGADTQEIDVTVEETAIAVEENAYSRALANAKSEAFEQESIYEFPTADASNGAKSLLTLLASEELSVTTEEAMDEWQYYLVFSLGEEEAVTYQIGKSKYVMAISYHGEEEPSKVIYQMKNVNEFLEALTGYLR